MHIFFPKSFIVLHLSFCVPFWVNFKLWYLGRGRFFFFFLAYGCPVAPTPFVENAIFPSLTCFCTDFLFCWPSLIHHPGWEWGGVPLNLDGGRSPGSLIYLCWWAQGQLFLWCQSGAEKLLINVFCPAGLLLSWALARESGHFGGVFIVCTFWCFWVVGFSISLFGIIWGKLPCPSVGPKVPSLLVLLFQSQFIFVLHTSPGFLVVLNGEIREMYI